MGYTKLFSEIVTSSIWNEDDKTRLVWITLLALSNADGYVSCVPTSLALLSRVPLDDCLKSVAKLQSNDPESRTPDHDGRRIEKVKGGWIILNYPKYRERVSDDPYAVSARLRQQKHRDKLAKESIPPTPPLKEKDKHKTEAEAEAESRDVTQHHTKADSNTDFDQFWQAYPRKQARKKALESWLKSTTKPEVQTILNSILEQMNSEQWKKDNGQFIPMPSTWLNQERWNDKISPASSISTTRKPFPGEILKLLDELRSQRKIIWNHYEVNGIIPSEKPIAQKEHSELCSKIRELEQSLQK